MNLLEPDWGQERPTDAEVNELWSSFRPRVHADDPPAALLPYIDTYASLLVNGKVQYARYDVPADPTLCWFSSRNRLDEIGFVNRALGKLATGLPKVFGAYTVPKKSFRVDTLLLGGKLAGRLAWGGAYKSYEDRKPEAKALGEQAAQAILGDRYDDFIIYETFDGWSRWFLGIAWDATLIVFDLRSGAVSFLCTTDTD